MLGKLRGIVLQLPLHGDSGESISEAKPPLQGEGGGRGPFCQNPAAVFINTTAVAVISDAVFANAKNVCDREKIYFCRK